MTNQGKEYSELKKQEANFLLSAKRSVTAVGLT